MSRTLLLEKGLSVRTLTLIVALVAMLGAAVYAVSPANALVTVIVVGDGDFDGDLDGSLADIDDASDIAAAVGTTEAVGAGSESAGVGALAGTGAPLALDLGAPPGTLYRTPAVGSIVDVVVGTAGDATLGNDIFSASLSVGGLNALTGTSPQLFTGGDYLADAGTDDEFGFTAHGQGIAGTSAVLVTSGGVTAGFGAPGGPGPKIVFVGGPAVVALTAPVAGVLAGVILNPGSFAAGSAAAFAGAGSHFYFAVARDAAGQRVLDGTPAFLSITGLTGAATFATFASVVGGGLLTAPVATVDEGALGGIGVNRGVLAFGLATTAGSGASGTVNVSFASGTVAASKAFVAAGSAASIVVSDPPGGDGPVLSTGPVPNGISTWTAFIADSSGSGVPGLAGAITVTTTGGLVAGVPAPIAPTGTYAFTIASGATTVPGSYDVTVSTTVGVTPVTETFTVVVGGAAASGTIVSDTDVVGINQSANVTVTFLDVLGNPVPDGSAIGPGLLVSLGLVGVIPTTVGGSSTFVFTAPAVSGTSTITSTLGSVTVQTTVDVGSAAGGIPDGLESTNGTSIEADVNENVPLSVLVTKEGSAFDSAIVRFEATGGSLAPAEVSTGPDGIASATAKFTQGGTFTVTATVFTTGPTDLIPVSGLNLVFTIEVIGEVSISVNAGLNIVGWTGGATSSAELLADNPLIDRIWSVVNGAWVVDSTSLPGTLRVTITVDLGSGLVIIATSGGTITGTA